MRDPSAINRWGKIVDQFFCGRYKENFDLFSRISNLEVKFLHLAELYTIQQKSEKKITSDLHTLNRRQLNCYISFV